MLKGLEVIAFKTGSLGDFQLDLVPVDLVELELVFVVDVGLLVVLVEVDLVELDLVDLLEVLLLAVLLPEVFFAVVVLALELERVAVLPLETELLLLHAVRVNAANKATNKESFFIFLKLV